MTDPSFFHRKNEADRNIPHIDKVQDKIEIQLKSSAFEKVSKHGGRRRQIVIVRTDRHRGATDDHRKTVCGSLQRQPIREHFRARVRPRHFVDR